MEETDRPEPGESGFKCVKCGECCRSIGHFSHVLPHQTDGVCRYLTGDLCSIYETRPDVCAYDRAYPLLMKWMTFREYHEAVVLNCGNLRRSKMSRINSGEMAGSAPD